jgi:two-component system, OmpR family, sensor histidine kinase TctE
LPTVQPLKDASQQPAPDAARMGQGLRRRLLVLLMVPLGLLALVSVYVDYRAAGNAAAQHDQQLQRHASLLANSIVGPGPRAPDPPLVLLAPPVAEFIKERGPHAGFRISNTLGDLLVGEAWIPPQTPRSREPEFLSAAVDGVTYRIVSQQVETPAGEYIVQLADGSDPRQQWLQSVLYKVLLPNAIIMVAAAFAISWAVRRALKPLNNLRDALERRSPRDLSEIEWQSAPHEVRPLITSLNHLFGLVNAQVESQRRFIADAAHQLRTPLAGLQSQVEAWAQHSGAAGGSITLQSEQLHKLRSATRRTSQLANQLLALSRADAQAMQTQPMHSVALKDLCEDTLAQFIDAARAKRMDLGLDASAVTVAGHEWLLREMLSNLTDNAIKYTPEGGTVTIRCGLREGRAFVEVEDDGPGIAQAERERVTERFYRVQGTIGEGNGLGLAITHEIARLHRAQWVLGPAADGRGLRAGIWFL